MSGSPSARTAHAGAHARAAVHRVGKPGGCAASVVGDHLAFRSQVGRARWAASVAGARAASGAWGAGGRDTDDGLLSGVEIEGTETTDAGLGAAVEAKVARVREVIGPILAPYGLDADSEDVEGVLDIPGLADQLVEAAVGAVGGRGAVEAVSGRVTRPVEGMVPARSSARLGGGPRRRPVAVRHDDGGTNDGYSYPDGVDPRGGATTAATDFPTASCFRGVREPRRAAVTWDEDIEAYTDHTGGYGPVDCVGYQTMPEDIRPCDAGFVRGTSNCSDEEHELVCSGVRFLSDHFDDRVPTLTRGGLDYTATIRDTMAANTVLRCVRSCEETSDGSVPTGYAATPGQNPYNLFIEIDPDFFSAELASFLLGARDFHAGVILHELLHSLETQWESSRAEDLVGPAIPGDWPGEGEVTISGAQAGCELGECRESCTPIPGHDPGGEWRAAYLQARFYGIDECGSQVFACAYARTFCAEFDEGTVHDGRLTWFAVKQAISCYWGVATIALIATVIGFMAAGGPLGALGGATSSILFSLLALFLGDARSNG